MSTVVPRPPAPPVNPALLDSERYIDDHIRRTRRSLKLVDFSAGVITLAVGLLAFLLAAGVIDHWVVPGGLSTAGRMTLFGVLLLGLSWYAWRQFVPLLRAINPVYAAHTIEKSSPSLKNSLLNLLLFRGHRQDMSAKVYHALEQQAAARLSTASVDAAIDRGALLRLGYALVAVVAACALYAVLSPKNLATSAARVIVPWADIAPPSRVQILNVEPGDASVARGERIAISAEALAVGEDEPVRLHYSTDDEQLVDETVLMTRPMGGARFAADLPRATDSGRVAGVMNDMEYWIEAGDARSRRFKLTVFDRPTIVVQRVHYQAPAYAGEPSRTVDNAGEVRGLEGTIVSIEALANQPIGSAYVDFDADGRNDLKMAIDDVRATASFELKLRPDRRTPLHTSYVLRYTTTAGRANAEPAQYRIEVTPDYAPEVRILKPEEPEQTAHVGDTVLINVEARDPDYAVSEVRLVGRVGESDVLVGDLLTKLHAGRFTGTKMFVPADAQLKPGDVLEYWAEARDNRRPDANLAVSEHRRLRIVAPDAAGGQQQQDRRGGGQPPQDPGQQGEGGEDQPGEQGGGQQQPGESGAAGQGGEDGGQQGGAAGGQGQSQDGESAEGGEAASAAGQSGGQNGESGAEGAEGGAGGENSQDSTEQSEQAGGGAAGEQQSQGGSEQQPGDESGAKGASGGGEQGGAPQERVSAEGDEDAEAFERIRQHMANQDAANRSEGGEAGDGEQAEQRPEGGEQQPAEGQRPPGGPQQGGDPQQSGGQQPAGGQKPPGASGGPSPDRAGANPQGEQGGAEQPSAGELADGQPGEGQAPTAGDGQQTQGASGGPPDAAGANAPNPQGQGETPAGADGALNQNNGASPAGDDAAGQPGAPEASNKRDRETGAERDDGESATEGEPATADSRGDAESDARGDQSGDRSGAGQKGGGQQADNAGQGEAGSHEASDTGAGQGADQGAGETGTEGGEQQLADGKTGESSGDQAGAGSETGETEGDQPSQSGGALSGGEQADGKQSGGKQSGKPPSGEQQGAPGGQQNGETEEPSDQRGDELGHEGQPGEQNSAGGQAPGEGQPSDAAGNQSPSDAGGSPSGEGLTGDQSQASDSQQQNSSQGGSAGAPPVGGGSQGGGVDGTSSGTEPGGDDANLRYARQQTDLVLQRLDEELAKQKVDPDILKRLGWNEDQLRRFVSRWKELTARADAGGADADGAKQQLDAALRSLGLRKDGPQRFRAGAAADQIRDLNDAYRTRPPLEYMDRVREYMKGVSAADEE